jgi:site-specific DNA recombinase
MFRQKHVEHLVMKYIESIRLDKSKLDLKQNNNDLDRRIRQLNKDLIRIRERRKKWRYLFVNDMISEFELRQHLEDEMAQEETITSELQELENQRKEDFIYPTRLLEITDVWDRIDNQQKRELIWTIFSEITLFTDEKNVKGVKNKFFPAWIEVKFN